jgi:hypothetical protein
MLKKTNSKSTRGGYRPGSGRKKGSTNKRTQEIAARAFDEGVTPLEFMLSVIRDGNAERAMRLDAAKFCAPYIHPRLQAVEISGKEGGPIETVDMTPLEFARRVAFLLEKGKHALEGT